MSKEFQTLKQEYETKKEQLFENMKAEFVNKSKEYFEKYPDVNSIGVPAYTMSFNDGEPCYWSLYNESESILVNEQTLDNEIDDMEDSPEYGTPEYEAIQAKYDDASRFFNNFPSDFYEDTFDEGAITVHRDGKITIEDCDTY